MSSWMSVPPCSPNIVLCLLSPSYLRALPMDCVRQSSSYELLTFLWNDRFFVRCFFPCSACNKMQPSSKPNVSNQRPIPEDSIGEGGDLSFSVCLAGYDGSNSVGRCGANDSTFANSFVARKGGAVAVGEGEEDEVDSYTEFHRCRFWNAKTVRFVRRS